MTGQSREIVKSISDRFPKKKTYRLSNGVDVDKFLPQKKSDILQQWSNGKELTSVYAGLHGIAQGLGQIIKAAVELEKTVPELQIILIGDGPEKHQLIDSAEELNISNFTFVEPQTKEKMPGIWASANIALVSLKQYIPGAVPSKLYEAMASGVPVIMIGEGEPEHIVKSANCGVTVKPNDQNALVEAFIKLVNDQKLKNAFGNNGRSYVKEHFNRENIMNEFLKYLESNVNY